MVVTMQVQKKARLMFALGFFVITIIPSVKARIDAIKVGIEYGLKIMVFSKSLDRF